MSAVQGKLYCGSNTKVLDLLRPDFENAIDCVYIDPPYNNGENYDFYCDSRKHEVWLRELSESLESIWRLLKNDGSLWISIDDGEMAYLKVLCDQLFGRKSFVASIVWQQRTTRENRNVFSFDHEYILVYSKDPQGFKKKRNLLSITDEVLSRYKNPDNDMRGPWQSVSLNVQSGHAVSSQFYEIVTPSGKIYSPPVGRCWIYNQERMQKEIEAGNIWFGKNGDCTPRKKQFLFDRKKGLVPSTLWLAEEVGTNQDAKKHLKKLFPKASSVFDTPKPESLVQRILEIATNEGDMVLDAYLGSGTTAAVAHKMNRDYIGIEREPKTFALAVDRIRQVIEGEKGGISKSVSWAGGGSCECYEAENCVSEVKESIRNE